MKWYNLLSINNDQPGVQLKVRVLQGDHPAKNTDDGSVTVHADDKFRLSFENPSSQSLYLAMLDLADNGKVKTVYQSNSPLPPQESSLRMSSKRVCRLIEVRLQIF